MKQWPFDPNTMCIILNFKYHADLKTVGKSCIPPQIFSHEIAMKIPTIMQQTTPPLPEIKAGQFIWAAEAENPTNTSSPHRL